MGRVWGDPSLHLVLEAGYFGMTVCGHAGWSGSSLRALCAKLGATQCYDFWGFAPNPTLAVRQGLQPAATLFRGYLVVGRQGAESSAPLPLCLRAAPTP